MAKRYSKPRKWLKTPFPDTSRASRSTESRFQTTPTPWSPRLTLNIPKLPAVRPREVIRFLERPGFVLDHASGSHFISYHPNTKRRAVLPQHNRDLPKGTLLSLLREAGFSRDDLIDFLRTSLRYKTRAYFKTGYKVVILQWLFLSI